jgi:asparagine synthase (glutamine-hydrolysing)
VSHAPGGPLATLPRYLPREDAPTAESVWRLAPEGLDPGSVAAFLWHVLPPEESLFRDVDRMPVMLPRVRRGAAPAEEEDRLAERLLSAIAGTVRHRVAEGARDVSLSGGVDSAALCMLAAREVPGQVRAWTMDVHFADTVERNHAKTVARMAGVELVDAPIPDAVLPDLFEPAVLSNEAPLINARAVASFAFYAEARTRGASVMLSGAGADEVLLGNPNALAGAHARVDEDRRLAREVLRPSAVDDLGPKHDTDRAPWALVPEDVKRPEEVRCAAWVLRELVLPPELRGARAHGLTVLTPYLDPDFMKEALALPESVLVRDGVGKWLFRQAVRGLVPDEVRLARKTPRYAHTALSSPVRERWLELYRAWLSPSRLEPLEVIDPAAVLGLLDRYTRLAPDASEASGLDRLLMRLVSLAMLHAHCASRTPCPES